MPNKTVNRALRSQQLNSCYHCVLSSLLPSPSARDCYLFTQCACARSCGDQRVLSKMPSSQTVHAIYSLRCQLMQSCAQLHASLPPTRDVSMRKHVTDVTPCPNKPPLISLNWLISRVLFWGAFYLEASDLCWTDALLDVGRPLSGSVVNCNH